MSFLTYLGQCLLQELHAHASFWCWSLSLSFIAWLFYREVRNGLRQLQAHGLARAQALEARQAAARRAQQEAYDRKYVSLKPFRVKS